MVVVDTSVWIDLFRGIENKNSALLKTAIDESEDIGICGIIFTEVLQGIRHDGEYKKVRIILDGMLYLPQEKSTHERAAELYRKLRKKGITIRKPVDCIIAAVCIENSAYLLHNDRDFEPIAKHFPLQRYR